LLGWKQKLLKKLIKKVGKMKEDKYQDIKDTLFFVLLFFLFAVVSFVIGVFIYGDISRALGYVVFTLIMVSIYNILALIGEW
jgi:hypothetical protein